MNSAELLDGCIRVATLGYVMMSLLWIRECIIRDVLREVQPELQRLFPGSGWVVEGDLPDLAEVAVGGRQRR